MRTSEQVLNRAEIEKSGLGERIQSLHSILLARYPFISCIALALYETAAIIMREVVAGHHERGDGSGYPRGLAMADIPVGLTRHLGARPAVPRSCATRWRAV